MENGIKRGLFSNEAGMGSTPNAAAQATVKHPAAQGLVQSFGVFVDTIVICSCTAVVILLSGVYERLLSESPGESIEGIQLTQDAMVDHLGALVRSLLPLPYCFLPLPRFWPTSPSLR